MNDIFFTLTYRIVGEYFRLIFAIINDSMVCISTADKKVINFSLRRGQSKLFNHPEENDRFDEDFNGSVNGSVNGSNKTSNESSVKQLNGSFKEMFSRSENGSSNGDLEEQKNQRNARKSQVFD